MIIVIITTTAKPRKSLPLSHHLKALVAAPLRLSNSPPLPVMRRPILFLARSRTITITIIRPITITTRQKLRQLRLRRHRPASRLRLFSRNHYCRVFLTSLANTLGRNSTKLLFIFQLSLRRPSIRDAPIPHRQLLYPISPARRTVLSPSGSHDTILRMKHGRPSVQTDSFGARTFTLTTLTQSRPPYMLAGSVVHGVLTSTLNYSRSMVDRQLLGAQLIALKTRLVIRNPQRRRRRTAIAQRSCSRRPNQAQSCHQPIPTCMLRS